MSLTSTGRDGTRRWWRRGPWETAASLVIGIGVLLLVQSFSLALYGYSFSVILAGTILFMIVSHFPE